MAWMLILTEYKICQKAQAIGSFFFFLDAEHQKNVIFEKYLPIFKSNLPPKGDATQKNEK